MTAVESSYVTGHGEMHAPYEPSLTKITETQIHKITEELAPAATN